MPVISVNEYTSRASRDRDGFRHYTITYKVRTTSKSDGGLTVLYDILSPAYGSTYNFANGYEFDSLAAQQDASTELISEDESGKLWLMTINYSTRPVGRPDTSLFGGGGGTTDPTSIVKISGGFVPHAEPATRDKDGDPIVNAAKDPFIDLVIDRHRPTLTIEKTYTHAQFTSLFDNLIFDVSAGRRNSATFFGINAGYWKLGASPWARVYYGETPAYIVTYNFEYDVRKWELQPANRGPRYIDGTKKVRFTDDKGLDYGGDGLGPLEDDGEKRTATDPPVLYFDGAAQSAGDPFEPYDSVDFGASPYSLPTGF